jgi:polyhydroxybutyrate depolymerase
MHAVPDSCAPTRALAIAGALCALAAIAMLLAARGPDAALAQSSGGGCAQPPAPGDAALTLTSGGLDRTAILHVPTGAGASPLPLLIGLHGAGGSFFERDTGFSTIADDEGFYAVYPDALRADGRGTWNINDHRPDAPNDVEFISDLIDQVERTACVDPARVYVAGISNGGGMAARLACQLSGRIAGIASVAGGYSSLPPCEPANPVSVIEIHGTSDGTVPYAGPSAGTGAVQPWVATWARRDGCRSGPQRSRVAPRVLRLRWSGCLGGTAVEHLEVMGGTHQYPGGLPPDPGPSSSISSSWEIWSFLRSHRLASGPAHAAKRLSRRSR